MTVSRKLAVSTVVRGQDGTGVPFVVFGPDDDDVPAWAADQIGDHCWADAPSDDAEPKRKPRSSAAK